jgi:trans-2,3-dihydro-3-hydroxyanthranilate isomerase
MKRRYVIADMFTDKPFSGNPVAVVLDTGGLTTEQMQLLAVEFGYSETTFVLPPEDVSNTAKVRIFTPSREIPFAGHPNVGTAFVLANQATLNGRPLPEILLFEEAAGLVPAQSFLCQKYYHVAQTSARKRLLPACLWKPVMFVQKHICPLSPR